MKVFISYASEDRDLAEKIHLALLGGHHETFFDKDKLPPGGSYRQRILKAIDESEAMVFLISPESIEKGSFARTELKQARSRWAHPRGRVLPVMARDVSYDVLPNYLGAVTVLEPEGDAPAEVVMAMSNFVADDYALPNDYDYATHGTLPEHNDSPPTAVIGATFHYHNMSVQSPQGILPGMQIVTNAQILNAQEMQIQLVAKFSYANGHPLIANSQEPLFRDSGGIVTTGTPRLPVTVDDFWLQKQVMTIPYYALNFQQTGGMMRHDLMFSVIAYAGEEFIGQSHPQPFFLQW